MPWYPLKFAAACSVLFALNAPSALASEPLTLPQAMAAALELNPDLAAARREIGIAEGARRQAGLISNPELSYEVEDTRRATSTTSIMLSQALELGGKRGARIDVASHGQRIALLALEQRRNELRAEVIQAFYAALRTQTAVDLARQSVEVTERGLRVVAGRVRAGKSSPVEANRAEVQVAQARLEVSRAETAKATAYRQLAQLTGDPLTSVERLASRSLSPGLPPAQDALLLRLEHTAELRQAVARIDQGDASLGSEKAQRLPNLTVGVGSQYDRSERERVNLVSLSMPLPLFDRNQGNVLAAARRADQARDLRTATELRLRNQTQTALQQWQAATQEVDAYDRLILPSAQRAVDTATRGFERGKFAFIEVLDAQRTLLAARSQYLETLAAATDARAQIERIYGDLEVFPLQQEQQ